MKWASNLQVLRVHRWCVYEGVVRPSQTSAAEIELAIPKTRCGSATSQASSSHVRSSERVLVSAIRGAYVAGVSHAHGRPSGFEPFRLTISKSEVSRIYPGVDEQVEAFATEALEAARR